MTTETTMKAQGDVVANGIAEEFIALAELLEAAGPPVWDVPSLCEGWRTREVVAHVTMPVRYEGPAFMAELEAAGGDFTRLSNTVAARDGAMPTERLLADLRSEVLHSWQPPGGGEDGALTHCVVHCLDIIEASSLSRRVPDSAHHHGSSQFWLTPRRPTSSARTCPVWNSAPTTSNGPTGWVRRS